MKLTFSSFNFIHTTFIQEKKVSFQNIALAIIPMPNNSQTNDRNVVKICFQAICEVNFTISLKHLGVYIEKNKIQVQTPHEDGPLRKRIKAKKLKQTIIHVDQYKFHFSTIICTEINCGVLFFSFFDQLYMSLAAQTFKYIQHECSYKAEPNPTSASKQQRDLVGPWFIPLLLTELKKVSRNEIL